LLTIQGELQEQETRLNQISSELIAVQQMKEDLSLKVEQSTINFEQNSQALSDLQKQLEDSRITSQSAFEELKALNLQQEDQLQLCMKEKNELLITQAENEVDASPNYDIIDSFKKQ
jgi:chromosome segregation ATPase